MEVVYEDVRKKIDRFIGYAEMDNVGIEKINLTSSEAKQFCNTVNIKHTTSEWICIYKGVEIYQV